MARIIETQTSEKESFGKRLLKQFAKGAGELVQPTIGAAKGVASMPVRGARLIETTGQAIGGKLAELVTDKQAKEQPSVLKGTMEKMQPTNLGQKLGYGAEQIAEFAIPGAVGLKTAKGAGLGVRMLEGALTTGGVTAFQEGELGKEAAIGAGIGAAFPLAGAVLKGVTGGTKRLIRKAIGITPNQAKTLNVIAKTKDPNTGKEIYSGVEDFLTKKGIIGKGKEILSRPEMKDRAESLFETTMANKQQLIGNITKKTKNKFSQLIGLLNKKVGGLNKANQGVLDDEVNFLKNIGKKKKLSAKEIDGIRSIADDLIYSEQDNLLKKSINRLITPLRSALDKLDKTATLKTVNTDIRLLQKLINPKGFLTQAVEKDVAGRASLYGGAALAAQAIPGIGQLASPLLGYEAATSIPQVAAPLARGLTKIGETITPEIAGIARGAITKGINLIGRQ